MTPDCVGGRQRNGAGEIPVAMAELQAKQGFFDFAERSRKAGSLCCAQDDSSFFQRRSG